MDYEFNSKEELYERVLPALKLKVKEFKRLGNSNITCLDVWDYLIYSSWKSGKNLMLSDIVNDILYLEIDKVISYLNEKH
jgi:hypothetical protein